jgi:hypothetical protein
MIKKSLQQIPMHISQGLEKAEANIYRLQSDPLNYLFAKNQRSNGDKT